MANHSRMAPILTRQEGRFANVSNAGQVAVDVGGSFDDWSRLRTAKPWGPDTPTLVSSLRDAIPASDGGLQARYTRATTEELLKPLRRECRLFPVDLVSARAFFLFCTRSCGCIEHPAFPAPFLIWVREKFLAKLGRLASRERFLLFEDLHSSRAPDAA